ncbi:MAG: hypothetical protein Q4G69_03165 [Planctomycetia bacterium]|nr:hypothetical protein [Planctomycetia bacterium]
MGNIARKEDFGFVPKHLHFGRSAPSPFLSKHAVPDSLDENPVIPMKSAFVDLLSLEEREKKLDLLLDRAMDALSLELALPENAPFENAPFEKNLFEKEESVFPENESVLPLIYADQETSEPDYTIPLRKPDPSPWEDESLSPEERCLVKLLGRPLTQDEREEYYWEDISSRTSTPPKAKKRSSKKRYQVPLLFRVIELPFVFIGHAIITTGKTFKFAVSRPSGKVSLPEEMNKPIAKKKSGHLSDMMISTITGVLIAAFIVYPALRLVGKEMYSIIERSTVRRIGEKVSLPQGAETNALLPFLSEKFLFPQTETVELGGERGSRSAVNEGKD